MTPTATPPTTANGPPHPPAVSPVEYVRGLPPEDKEAIFLAILREVIAYNGGKGLIPIDTPEGESLGYYVPPEAAKARFELYGPKLTPEDVAELKERVRNPGPFVTAEELVADLRAEAERLERQAPGPSARPD